MAFYVKKSNKPIEAKELLYSTKIQEEIIEWINSSGGVASKGLDGGIWIETPEGKLIANTGSFIMRGYTEKLGWHFWAVDDSYMAENYEKYSD